MVTNTFDVVDLINLGVAIAIILATALAVFYLFMGGMSFILSGGEEDKIGKAVRTIRYAILGLIITILAVSIIKIVGYVFGFNLLNMISWDRISVLMTQIMDRIASGGSSSFPGGGGLR